MKGEKYAIAANLDARLFERFHDIRLVWTPQGYARQGAYSRDFCELGSGFFRVLPPGARESDGFPILFTGAAQGNPRDHYDGRVWCILRHLHENSAQARLSMGLPLSRWCRLFYVPRI